MVKKKETIGFAIAAAIGAALPLVGSIPDVGATHDPAIDVTYPNYGWAAQAHNQGHNGYGVSNKPTYYGGTTTSTAGYWYTYPVNSPVGYDSCAANRYQNMNQAENISEYTTIGSTSPQVPDWPIGLYMSYAGCNVSKTSRTLFTSFVDATGGGSPGYTVHRPATSTQCSSQGLSHPCGDWSTVTEVQKSWWDSKSTSERQKLLLHEWGHSWGMGDYCGTHADALSRNGTTSCPWPTTGAYYDLDDRALFLIYGN